MAVTDTDTVDLVLTDESGAWILVISEEGGVPEDPETLARLRQKINLYAFYVRSGQLVRDHPAAEGGPVRIWLAHGDGELGPGALEVVRTTGDALRDAGIEVHASRVSPGTSEPSDSPGDPGSPARTTRKLHPDDGEDDAERAFLTARLTGNFGDAAWHLSRMEVHVPLADGGRHLMLVGYGDRSYAALYTSRRTLLNTVRSGYDSVSTVPFLELARDWDQGEVGIAVNPGTDALLAMPPDLVSDLVAAADTEADPGADRPAVRVVPVRPPSEVNGFRFASVVDGVAADGTPTISPERGYVEDPAERERIARYLDAGLVIRLVGGFGPDLLDPAHPRVVPVNSRTDGTWIWSDSVHHHLTRHHLAPEPDLYRHIRERSYVCPEVTRERADAAAGAQREHDRVTAELQTRWREENGPS